MSLEYEIFKLGYEISPVILVDGIASLIPGGMLPILALTQAADFTLGLLSGGNVPSSLDQYVAHWRPLPGTMLISNQIAPYPFANQSVAANATISQPLTISMLMECPVQQAGGYATKLAMLTLLQQTLLQHNAAGGTYTVATPGQFFTNCILLQVRDVSGSESKQVQHSWQFDFVQPLITINEAQQVYNSLMNKIAGGLPTGLTPTWSGILSTVSSNIPIGAGSAVPVINSISGSVAGGVSGGAISGILSGV